METTRHVTWRQAMAYGWAARTATFSWTNDVTGRRCHRADGLNVAMLLVMKLFARQGRTPLDPKLTMMRPDVKYEIGLPSTPKCKRCGKETWDIAFRACRVRCLARASAV